MAVLGFSTGGLLAERDFLHLLTAWLSRPTFSRPDVTSFPALLNVSAASVIAAAVFLIGISLWVLPKPSPSPENWPWYRTGVVLAALGTLAWIAGSQSGWHWGLSMTGPSRSLMRVVMDRSLHSMTWGAFMLLGVPVGSFFSARSMGTAHWQVPELLEFARRFLGGLLMGFGGTLAGGCNIGNALTGLSILSLNSFVATASIVVGLALAIHVQDSIGWR
jgi:Sulphur transport